MRRKREDQEEGKMDVRKKLKLIDKNLERTLP